MTMLISDTHFYQRKLPKKLPNFTVLSLKPSGWNRWQCNCHHNHYHHHHQLNRQTSVWKTPNRTHYNFGCLPPKHTQ